MNQKISKNEMIDHFLNQINWMFSKNEMVNNLLNLYNHLLDLSDQEHTMKECFLFETTTSTGKCLY